MKYRLKDKEAHGFLDAHSDGRFSERLNSVVKWMLTTGEAEKGKHFYVGIVLDLSFAKCVSMTISSNDIEEDEE